ncbi:MAG: HDIG domain-containing protein [Eubacteriales bacterium]|nr:HDIG domain-containing protein [Eubacteriales bacterium]MDD3867232.1 HDIG domain-containing protein [Eubacteriales bacterium]MDD4461156.1 HDIG domain-containing protein [Eubacteriales bacterium]
MKLTGKAKRIRTGILLFVLIPVIILTVYYASIPQRYVLQPGDVSTVDLTAPRSIRDRSATDLRAAQAAAGVTDVMLRSEQIVEEVHDRTESFLAAIAANRQDPPLPTPTMTPVPTEPDPADETEPGTVEPTDEPEQPEEDPVVNPALLADQIALDLNRELDLVIGQDEAMRYALISDDRFESISGHIRSVTNLIMAESVDQSRLRTALSEKIESLSASITFNQEDVELIDASLRLLLRPNVVFDQVATENARKAAYDSVQNNPVMIEKGTRIVALGEVITDERWVLLRELSLIDDGSFDYLHLFGIILMLAMLLAIAWAYLHHYDHELFASSSDLAALILALLIPFFVSAYIGRDMPLAPPVYFAAVLIAVYFSFRSALVMTFLLTAAIWPMTGFDPLFLLIAFSGGLVAALFTKGIIRKNNYAFIILATSGINFLVVAAYGLMQKEGWTEISINSLYSAASGGLSVIAAIGIMPVFEMLFNTVSPLRLIELSQPGHPLLRRLFVEAPGSSQHSMMVANLADAASLAIGANALLARVGAYYHDIGKLENPQMFIENQEGQNPHDSLLPDDSARVILRHPDDGLKIGRRYRLPPAILRIIHEHHGSTTQAYFYHRARKLAEEGQMAPPEPEQYRYHCPVPSSQESAVVMMADSFEAAMKSAGITNLTDAEALLRKIIKGKIEQDQLTRSGLSFNDLEKIIRAFLQVYAGHFHERIAYPDDRSVRQPANTV